MSEKTENQDFFDEEIEKYTKKYASVFDEADDSSFVDELFESSDGTPIRNWSMDDINRLIDEVENTPDMEVAGDDFDEDRYEEYSEPEKPSFAETKHEEREEVYEAGAVYFSKEYEKDLVSREKQEEPSEFEDFSSVSDSFEEDFFADAKDEDFSAVEGNVNEARGDGEFREIDETLDIDGFEQEEVVYDGTFDRGDYLKIKDIFKNSKILSRRRQERAEVRESAIETVKEKYGEAIFEAKKKEEDFNEILRRQRQVEKEKEERTKREKRFDVDREDYIVSSKPKTENLEIQEDEDLDDTIFIDGLSSFEAIAKENRTDEEDFSGTKVIGEKASNTRNIFISPQNRRRNDDQMRFEGFPEDDFEPDTVDEEKIEENLRKTREEKKNLFRMTSLPEDYDDTDPNYFCSEKGRYDEEEYMVLSDENHPKSFFSVLKNAFVQEKNKKFTEYTTSNEKPQVFKELSDRRSKAFIGLIAMSVMTIVFVLVSVTLGAIEAIDIPVQSTVIAVLSVICSLLTFVFGSCVTQPGIQGILKKKFGIDSAVTVLVLASIFSSASIFFDLSGLGDVFPVYTLGVLMSVVITCFGRVVEADRAISALKTATSKRKDNLYTIQSIEDEATAGNIARIFAGENPDLKYPCKTDFPSGFVFHSFVQNPADRFSRIFFPILAGLSAIVAIISGIVMRSVPFAFSALMLCLLISFPISVLPALNLALCALNRRLKKKNACITGYVSTRNIEKTNAVVVDSIDLFDIDKCNFHGMKDYETVRVDDIILYAAAMLTNSRGPLAHVFDKAILGNRDEMLPAVEDLCYEERLGLSGWIKGEKVLIGNRNLLINHNLEAPPKGAEVGCLKDGKKVLYVAIGGQVAAMLVVEYAKNENMKKYLSRLDKHGITIVVTTNDCNIDEDFLSLEFNMPRESFKVVGDYEGGLLDGYIHKQRKTAPAKLIHDAESASFFETFTSALSYSSSIKITLAVQAVLMFLSLVVAAIFALSGHLTMLGVGLAVLIQLVSLALISLVAIIRAKI